MKITTMLSTVMALGLFVACSSDDDGGGGSGGTSATGGAGGGGGSSATGGTGTGGTAAGGAAGSGGGTAGGGAGGTAGTGGGGGADASTGGAAGDAAAEAAADAGCTDLVSTQTVTSQASSATYPTPAGGTINDGTYILSKWEIFPSDTTPTGVNRLGALRFKGNSVEGFEHNLTSGFKVSGKGTYSTAGSTITFAYSCPAAGGYSKSYTATATQLIWFETDAASKKQIWTYTKQ